MTEVEFEKWIKEFGYDDEVSMVARMAWRESQARYESLLRESILVRQLKDSIPGMDVYGHLFPARHE